MSGQLPRAVLENQQDMGTEQSRKKVTVGEGSRVSAGAQWVSAGLGSEGSQAHPEAGQVQQEERRGDALSRE